MHTLTAAERHAARSVLPGVSDAQIRAALRAYGAWHLPTLRHERAEVHAALQRTHPEGGAAWSALHQIDLVLAIRTAPRAVQRQAAERAWAQRHVPPDRRGELAGVRYVRPASFLVTFTDDFWGIVPCAKLGVAVAHLRLKSARVDLARNSVAVPRGRRADLYFPGELLRRLVDKNFRPR